MSTKKNSENFIKVAWESDKEKRNKNLLLKKKGSLHNNLRSEKLVRKSTWSESPQHRVEKRHVIISNGLIKLNPKIKSERDRAYKYPLFYSYSHSLTLCSHSFSLKAF